jgi:hypothetical protein
MNFIQYRSAIPVVLFCLLSAPVVKAGWGSWIANVGSCIGSQAKGHPRTAICAGGILAGLVGFGICALHEYEFNKKLNAWVQGCIHDYSDYFQHDKDCKKEGKVFQKSISVWGKTYDLQMKIKQVDANNSVRLIEIFCGKTRVRVFDLHEIFT